MSRASDAGNGVMRAVTDYCGLYRVPFFRMQSRTFQVVGEGGKPRPFFAGEWTDLDGQVRRGGMADLLLMPRVPFYRTLSVPFIPSETNADPVFRRTASMDPLGAAVTVSLWVECKAGNSKLTPEQRDFRDYIQSIGAYYLLVENDPEILLAWFKQRGVI